MSQEYTEDKEVTLHAMSGWRRLSESLLILVMLFSLYLMVALISFNPSDPSWSQTSWHEPIHNLGGSIGACLADMLLFMFGIMAYAIPVIMFSLCLIVFTRRNRQSGPDYFAIGVRLIGAVALVFSICGLAALNINDIWYFTSGGVTGSLVSTVMAPWFSPTGSTLTLLSVWAAGVTLYTGWSWLSIAEKLGATAMGILAFARNNIRSDKDQWDEEKARCEFDKTIARAVLPEDDDDVLLAPPARRRNEGDEQNAYRNENDPLTSEACNVASHTVHEVPEGQQNTPDFRTSLQQNSPSDTPLYHFEIPTAGPTASCFDKSNGRQASPPCSGEAPALSPAEFSHAAPVGPGAVNDKTAVVTEGVNLPSKNDNEFNRQVKWDTGPQLPRPNKVKIPTRRELASYGIRLPSQRLQEKINHQTDQNCSQGDPSVAGATEREIPLDITAVDQQQRFDQQPVENTINIVRSDAQHTIEHLNQSYAVLSGNLPDSDSDNLNGNISADTDNCPPASASVANLVAAREGSSMREVEQLAAQAHWQQQSAVQTVISTLQPEDEMSRPPGDAATDQNDGSVSEMPVSSQESDQSAFRDTLFHPFLVRHEQLPERPATPLPTLDLLTPPPSGATPVDMFALEQTARLVEARLADYRVKAEVVGISPGPVITRFELDLAPGVKAARISNLARDLARSLSAVAVRVVEVIPGKPYVGLELPNKHRQTVYLREVLSCAKFRENDSPLSVVLGKDIAGQPVVADLAKMPHLLVAGTTGSGKSVGVNTMIISMLYRATPEEVRFIMIDPKMLELSVYEGIPHLLTEVVTDMKDAANALRWSVGEMERRYKLMSALGVRNLAGYNDRVAEADAMGRPVPDPFWKPGESMETVPPALEKLPYIVVMVDEFADLMMAVGKKVEELIARLAQKARAAGIHLVLATQRPSVDVITGLIKANIPTRIAFTVSSKIDSRTILDQGGAESLLGMGDMLYMPPNSSIPLRVHGAFVRDQEVHAVVQDWKARGRPNYIDSITAGDENEGGGAGLDGVDELDPLFDQAVAFVVEKRRASISGVQRQFRIGYNRAARIVEQMEVQGIVSSPGHNGNRDVLSLPPHQM